MWFYFSENKYNHCPNTINGKLPKFYILKVLPLSIISYFAKCISLKNQFHKNLFHETRKKTFAKHGSCSERAIIYLRALQELSEVIIVTSNYEWRPFWLHWQDKEKQVKRTADGIQIKILERHFNSNWNMLFWKEKKKHPFPRNFWRQRRLRNNASQKQKRGLRFSIWINFWFWC